MYAIVANTDSELVIHGSIRSDGQQLLANPSARRGITYYHFGRGTN